MWVVFPIRVVGDTAAFVGGDLVLVDDPFESGGIAKAVFVGLGRDSGEREELVVDERSLVFAQLHFGDAIVELFFGLLRFLKRIFRLLFVVDVNFGQPLACFTEGTENVAVTGSPTKCVILSGVKGFARESLRGVERPRVGLR